MSIDINIFYYTFWAKSHNLGKIYKLVLFVKLFTFAWCFGII